MSPGYGRWVYSCNGIQVEDDSSMHLSSPFNTMSVQHRSNGIMLSFVVLLSLNMSLLVAQSTDPFSGPTCALIATTNFPFGFGPDGLTPLAYSMTAPSPSYTAITPSVVPLTALGLSPSDLAIASESDDAMQGTSPTSSTPNPAIAPGAPSPTPTPSTIVQLSLDSVHIGELAGSALYNSAWSAVSSKCADPPATQCDIAIATVSNVGTIVDTTNTEGEITFQVKDSYYSTIGERNAMLGAIAMTLQQSATNQSCSPVPWVEKSGEKCLKKAKRVDFGGAGADTVECRGTIVLCNSPDFISTSFPPSGMAEYSVDNIAVEINEPGAAEAAHMNIGDQCNSQHGTTLR